MANLIYLDTETLDVTKRSGSIIQLAGIIEIDGKIKEKFNYKFRPVKGSVIEKECLNFLKENSGISKSTILGYEAPSKFLNEWLLLLNKYVKVKQDRFVIVGYNVNFDIEHLRNWFKLMLVPNMFFKYFESVPIDVMNLIKFLLQDISNQMSNFKLGNVYKVLSDMKLVSSLPESTRFHDAMFDIEMTRNIYVELLEPLSLKFEERI